VLAHSSSNLTLCNADSTTHLSIQPPFQVDTTSSEIYSPVPEIPGSPTLEPKTEHSNLPSN